METDEIIEEVYRIRLELAAQSNFDIRLFAQKLQESERREKNVVIIHPDKQLIVEAQGAP